MFRKSTWKSVRVAVFSATALVSVAFAYADNPWVVYDGFDGPGNGKQIVLVSGDEEYRSEEFLPQLGKILAKHHGFNCTVLFAVDPVTVSIDPNNIGNIPGLESLDSADLLIISTRFRDLPDEQMAHIDRYVKSGKPIIGIRTATHAFNIPEGKTYAKYSFDAKTWDGGFGRQILGETWIAHHGNHGSAKHPRRRSRPAKKTTPSSAAAAIFGGRPTFMKCGSRCPAIAIRSFWVKF